MFDETKITQEAYDNLFGDKGYLTKLKQRVDNGELFIVSQGLTVYDTKSKMASTIDLLVADANSNLTIVAVTPDSKSNWDIFNKKDNPKSKIKQAAMLQTANANLLMSMLGTEAKIAVLPIEMSVSTTDDKILSANKPTSPTLLATDFLIALNKAEAQAEIDKLIPVEKATTTDTKADIERKTTKVISSEIVEKGNRKGQTRTVTQTNFVENVEGTLVSVTEYEAKVGDTRVTEGGRKMTFKEFKEEFPLDEEYKEILANYPDLNDDTIITVIKVKRTSNSSRFSTVVSISSFELGGKMDITIEKDDAKYNAELAALETNVVPADAESSDDVESPAVEAEVKEREVVVIDESVRYKISDFKADLDKVTTKEELNNLLADLSIKNSEQLISYEDLQEMATMVKEKANQLNTPQDIKIVPESLAPGTELVAKNTIFVSGVNVQVDETVVVKSVNASNKTIVVTPLNSTSSVTLTFSTLNQSFTLKDAVMNATEIGEEKVTPEDKIKIVESTDLVDTFVQNKTGRIDQIEETASAKSLEELDEELMDDLEC
jgi:hypothetical protein